MSVIDSQVAMLSQVVARGVLVDPSTATASVWVGELENGVYIISLSSDGGVNVGFYITQSGTVSPLLSGQGTAGVASVLTVLPNVGFAGAVSLTATGTKYNLAVTTGTANGGPTQWRITRCG
jgi:hypothetical protein